MAVPWSVPLVPLMRAVRPNSVTTVTTVSRHAVAHVRLDRRERAVERAEQRREPAAVGALVDVRVPAVEGERADARAVGAREEFRRGAGRVGEEGAHLRGEACGHRLPSVGSITVTSPARASVGEIARGPSSARASSGSVW